MICIFMSTHILVLFGMLKKCISMIFKISVYNSVDSISASSKEIVILIRFLLVIIFLKKKRAIFVKIDPDIIYRKENYLEEEIKLDYDSKKIIETLYFIIF